MSLSADMEEVGGYYFQARLARNEGKAAMYEREDEMEVKQRWKVIAGLLFVIAALLAMACMEDHMASGAPTTPVKIESVRR